MYWKEKFRADKGLKLKINLRHQFHGYQVRVKAPAGYLFSITDGANSTLGAKLYPSVTQIKFKMSDMTLTQATVNTSSTNPEVVQTDFLNLMGNTGSTKYDFPYLTVGRTIRFVDPANPSVLWAGSTTFIEELYCDETSLLTIYDQNYPQYLAHQSVIRIHDITLRRISDNKTTSNQTLFIPNIDMKRYKMNRININLTPPAGF